jgi:tellurite resistance protein TerC
MIVGFLPAVFFTLGILALLAVDLGVFNRRPHAVSTREALVWSCVWVSLALLFSGWLFWKHGAQLGSEFLAGYLIEWSLSVDNIFVFVLIFAYFRVPKHYQHRVLFWGIISALALRGTMILAGAVLLERFHWVIYVFGLFLIVTGIRMAFHRNESLDPSETWIVRTARRLLPISRDTQTKNFLQRENGRWVFTPLFLVLLVVETTDVVFALDSIPAIFAVTRNPFIVYTSNVFAILGLRSLYFLLAGVMEMFRYLKIGLSAVLVFVGIKMLLSDSQYEIPTPYALGVIAAILATSIATSIAATRRESRSKELPREP